MIPIRIKLGGIPQVYRERQRVPDGQERPADHVFLQGRRTRSYQLWLRQAAQDAMDGRPPLDCAVCMTMTAFMPIPTGPAQGRRALAEQRAAAAPKRPDMTQLLKPAEDAFTAVVWVDDARVAEHRLRKVYRPRPRLEVEVRPIADTRRPTAEGSTRACGHERKESR